MLSSILLKSYINLSVKDRDFIVLLCSINLLFSFYYIGEISRLEKIFKLENKNIIKFGKRIGVITLFYIPFLFLLISLLFRDTHNLERIIIFLIILIELLIIGVVFKEVYDLVFLEQTRRDFEIEENRKKYIDKEIRTSLKE
ncbi:MAG: hypothetical protein ACFFBC_10265 [Promethearchaeota archaeon]